MVLRRHALVIFAFFGLACLAMYWIILNLPDFMPGNRVTDFYFFHWNYWWVRHVLITPGLNIYETNYVFAPATSSLAYHTLALIWYPVWALVEPLGGTFVAMTAVSLVAFTLNGYCFFLLLRYEGVSSGLALVGGAMLEFTPFMLEALNWTNTNLYGWFWIPVIILVWGRVADHTTHPGEQFYTRPILWTLVLGISLWGMVMTDVQYPLFALPLVLPYALLRLWRARDRGVLFRLVGYGVLGAVLGVALLWFAGPLPYILAFDRTGLALTPVESAVKVPFPEGYFGNWKATIDTPMGAVVVPAFLLALLVSLIAARWRGLRLPKKRWFWAALAVVPLVLSAGPWIMIGGAQVTLPYVWLHDMMGGMFRYPQRFGPVFLIAAVLFVMMTLTPILARWGGLARRLIPTLFLFVVIADSLILNPFPILPVPKHYDFYDAMGKEPYDYVVLEVPTGGASGEGLVGELSYSALQYYGTIHGKRMVNGHISRVNTYRYTYMLTDDPMMSWLGQRVFLDPERVEEQLRERIPAWPIGYIVVHRDLIWHDGPTIQEVLGYLNSLPDLLCPVWVEGDAVVYRTYWHPDGCPVRVPPETAPGEYTIDMGANEDAGHIGWGWHYAEDIIPGLSARWTGEYPDARLYLDLPPGAYQISLDAQAFYHPRDLHLLVNGVSVGRAQVSQNALQNYRFAIPADLVGDGIHLTLTLAYDGTDTPRAVGLGESDRKLAILVDRIQFRQVADES